MDIPFPPQQNVPQQQTHRLSLPFGVRLLLTTTTSFLFGASLGSYLGAHRSALIFRAENAHRMPRSSKGWYFYHKTKNYRAFKGGIIEGVRNGVRVAAWVSMFVVFEDAVDRLRGPGRVDAAATVCAGLGGAGVFSVWNRFSYGMVVRTAKKGLTIGLAYGIAQDALRCLKREGGGIFEYMGIGKRIKVEE